MSGERRWRRERGTCKSRLVCVWGEKVEERERGTCKSRLVCVWGEEVEDREVHVSLD